MQRIDLVEVQSDHWVHFSINPEFRTQSKRGRYEMGKSYLLDVRSRYRHREGAPRGKTGLVKSGDMPATKLKVAPPVWEGSHGLNCRGEGKKKKKMRKNCAVVVLAKAVRTAAKYE